MTRLAIHGMPPVFNKESLADYLPGWPFPHPETEHKQLEILRSGEWSMFSRTGLRLDCNNVTEMSLL